MENFESVQSILRSLFLNRKVRGPFGIVTVLSTGMLINAGMEFKKLEERRVLMKELRSNVNCAVVTVVNSGNGVETKVPVRICTCTGTGTGREKKLEAIEVCGGGDTGTGSHNAKRGIGKRDDALEISFGMTVTITTG